VKIIAANSLLFASCLPDTIWWRLATRRVAKTQERLLLRIVRENAVTAFGREHGFSSIQTIADYRARVPVRDYSEFEPYIDRCAAGEARVLSAQPVNSFALSSGSTSASKSIPYTPALLRDFRRSIAPWLVGIFLEAPGILAGKSYWQISPVAMPTSQTSSGISIGFGEDTQYFGPRRAALVRATLAVRESISDLRMNEFHFESLRQLLACRNLRFISVWNPSFLTLLLADLTRLASPLLERLRLDGLEARALELETLFRSRPSVDLFSVDTDGRTLPEAIWPELRLISCWTDAEARDAASRLRALFPRVAIQPKGLIATEGLMSFPWRAAGNCLAITSHFFEFAESDSENDQSPLKLAHELEIGRRYSILLTTSGGFYRYRIGDVVEVVGHLGQCPLLAFMGKEDGVVDLVGEKLNALHVARTAQEVFAKFAFSQRFWMLAPDRSQTPPCYVLYLQSDSCVPSDARSSFEAALEENFHYAYARRLGQLGPLQLSLIDPASEPEADYLRACAARGQRMGDIKRHCLDRQDGWSRVFKCRENRLRTLTAKGDYEW
jgi:hypothetical protein